MDFHSRKRLVEAFHPVGGHVVALDQRKLLKRNEKVDRANQ
jgi:hypothetical protein